jgi:hypothetical protein
LIKGIPNHFTLKVSSNGYHLFVIGIGQIIIVPLTPVSVIKKAFKIGVKGIVFFGGKFPTRTQ